MECPTCKNEAPGREGGTVPRGAALAVTLVVSRQTLCVTATLPLCVSSNGDGAAPHLCVTDTSDTVTVDCRPPLRHPTDLNMSTPRDPPARDAGAAARPPDQVCKELADVFEKEVLPRLDPAVRPGR